MNEEDFENPLEQMKLLWSEAEEADETVPLVPKRGRDRALPCALAALLHVVAFGMVGAYASPATVDMARPGNRFEGALDDTAVAWIAALPQLSGILGNAVAGYFSQRLGRKALLVYVSLPYAFGWLLVAYAPTLPVLYFGRLLSGFGGGVVAVVAPIYAAEVASTADRGRITALYQSNFAIGTLVAVGVGSVLPWSWLAIVGASVVTSALFLVSLVPESPPWLAAKRKNVEAFKALRYLRGGSYETAAREFRQILNHLREEEAEEVNPWTILEPSFRRPLAIAICLMLFQQFSGINPLMAYSVDIFQRSSNPSSATLSPTLSATLFALVQVLSTGASSMLMDKIGRRPLYVTSGLGAAIGLIATGFYSFSKGLPDWLPLAGLVCYMAAFSVGLGPIPFVVIPETVQPTRMRSFLLAVASVCGSLFSFAVTLSFSSLRTALGEPGMYWTYAIFSILGSAFYWKFVPETRGRTIRDIHRLLSLQ